MSFDGIFLKRILQLSYDKLVNASINSVSTISNNEYIFSLYKDKKHYNLLICINNAQSYFTILENKFERNVHEGSFPTLLNKHLSNGKIIDVKIVNNDRILDFYIKKFDEIGEVKEYHMIIELTGKLTNIILTNSEYIIIDAINKYLGESSRSIVNGVKYEAPELKVLNDPYSDKFDSSLTIKEQFSGFSSNLLKEFEHRMKDNNQSFEDIMDEIKSAEKIRIYKSDYHFLDLSYLNEEYIDMDVFEGLRYFYNQKKVIKPTIANDLIKLVNRQINHNTSKISKLEKELKCAENSATFQNYGDLIFTYFSDQLDTNKNTIEVEGIVIKLDEKLTLKENALKFYKKAQKLKKSVDIINEQINITKDLITYHKSLVYSLEVASPIELEDIKDELSNEHIIKQVRQYKPKQKKNNFLEYQVDGIKITVGKNNIQNELLTLKLAKYNEYFFHVKDYPGSHVILHTDKLNEKLIRYAANVAAVHSSCSESQSVPVDYCLVKDVKRHPSNKPGQVIIKNYKTIYIDPNKKLI